MKPMSSVILCAMTQLSEAMPDLNTLRARGTRKWTQYPADVIPMFVAESDFPTAPAVKEAIVSAAQRDMFGYTPAPHAHQLPEAVADFYSARYGWRPDPGHVALVPDVVRGVLLAIEHFTTGPVIVPIPAYFPFLSIADAAGRERVDIGSDNGLDLVEVESAFQRGAGSIIVTNPFNPGGWMLNAEELDQICAIARRYNGRVIVDEIHAPLTYGVAHVCAAQRNPDVCITVTAASKAWNVAGLKCAQMIFSNDADVATWKRVNPVLKDGVGTLGIVAAQACYRDGREFLDEEVAVLKTNRDWLVQHLPEAIEGIGVTVPDATYLMMLDFTKTKLATDRPARFLLEHAKVALSEGRDFGPGGEHRARLNFATSPAIVKEAVGRLARAIELL